MTLQILTHNPSDGRQSDDLANIRRITAILDQESAAPAALSQLYIALKAYKEQIRALAEHHPIKGNPTLTATIVAAEQAVQNLIDTVLVNRLGFDPAQAAQNTPSTRINSDSLGDFLEADSSVGDALELVEDPTLEQAPPTIPNADIDEVPFQLDTAAGPPPASNGPQIVLATGPRPENLPTRQATPVEVEMELDDEEPSEANVSPELATADYDSIAIDDRDPEMSSIIDPASTRVFLDSRPVDPEAATVDGLASDSTPSAVIDLSDVFSLAGQVAPSTANDGTTNQNSEDDPDNGKKKSDS